MKNFYLLLILILGSAMTALGSPDFYLRGHEGVWFEQREEYKFHQSGNIYTLHVDKLTSENTFKISTADYSIQYGTTDAFAYDKPMLCIDAYGNNFAISDKTGVTVAGATLTLDRTNPDAVTLTVTPDLYLAGTDNGWYNCDPGTRFTYHDGVYTLALRQLTGPFRISAGILPEWTIEYGGRQKMRFNREYSCTSGPGNDMTMEQRFDNVLITFNKEAHTIKVSDNTANYSGQEFYLRGHEGNWESRDEYKFQCHGSVYTIHVPIFWQDQTFKICNWDYSLQFGSTSAFEFDKDITCVNAYGNNFRIPEPDGGNVRGATMIFDYGNREAPTLKVIPDLYLVGQMTEWINAIPQYRFENRHGVFTLFLEKLYGDFKLAAGGTPEWLWEFGGQKNMTVGNTYPLTPGPGNTITVNGGSTVYNVMLVFDYHNKKLTVKNAEIDLEDRDLYLAGSFNGWNGSDQRYKFTRNGDHYTLLAPKISGEFKVVTSDWAYQIGCNHPISLFTPTSCVVSYVGRNMELADGVQSDAEVNFYPSTMTIEISGRPTMYLTGDFNNWSISPLYAFDYDNGKYILDTHDFTGNFKIVTNDHLIQFGKAADDITAMGVNYDIKQVGNYDDQLNFRGTGSGNPSQRIRLTLDPDGVSGIIDNTIDVDEDATIEYFNLQGIRVTRPANGIYIRRRGNISDKVFIK